jgi:hypothetical protein
MTDQFPGATKMVLSPIAQAVASAYDDTPEKETGNHRYHWIAAAFRAAADHLRKTSPWPGHIESTGVNWSSNQLFMIADELENQ